MSLTDNRTALLARRRRVEEIFDRVADLAAAERVRQLAAACGGDAALRAEVETLLRHDLSARGELEAMVAAAAEATGGEPAREGLRLGPWRLVRELGRGGMGSVWLGERVDGDFEQQVAIKLIRPGLESESLVHRFEGERRILAGLVHPSIARLYDGGASPDGRPYLVMEYVEGRPLTEAAETLPLERRLELFLAVTDAVAYAHRNLVVHRDLKPGNILVERDGSPKLLDFGIAKLIDPAKDVTQTVAGALAFSPEYASPEQVTGQPITTATDVYGLGAVLYELLTGKKAQPVTTVSPVGIYQAVFDAVRPRPSLVAAKELRRRLAGDLDAIVMKALRLEPEARYASAAELAEDLRRYLEAKPVRARQGSFAYHARLFARRHRAAVVAGGLIFLSLLGGLGATRWQMREREKAAERAERRFGQVRGLATRFLFDFDRAIAKLPGSTEARRMVTATAAEHLDGLAAEASGDEQLQLELAQAYFKLARVQGSMDSSNLGRRSEALASIAKGLALASRWERSDDPGNLEVLGNLHLERAIIYASLGQDEETLVEIEAGLAVSERVPQGTEGRNRLRGSLLLRLADLRVGRGEPALARAALEEALSYAPKQLASTWARLGLATREEGDLKGALLYFEEAARVVADSSDRCRLEVDLARTRYFGDWPSLLDAAAAREGAERGLVCAQELLALDTQDARAHLVLLQATSDGGLAVADPVRSQAFAELAEETVATLEKLAPEAVEADLETGVALLTKAGALARQGRRQEAEAAAVRAISLLGPFEANPDPRAADGLWMAEVLAADLLAARGGAAEAAAAYRRAGELAGRLAARRPRRPMRYFFLAHGNEKLARLLAAGGAGERAEARRLAEEAMAAWRQWKLERLTTSYADGRMKALRPLLLQLGGT